MNTSLPSGVLVHLPPDTARHQSVYYHCELALAEGFRALGIPVHGNRDYWRPSPSAPFTISAAPAGFSPDLHLHACFGIAHDPLRFAALRRPGRHVVIDWGDGESPWLSQPAALAAHLVLRAHYRADLNYLPNVRPWAFGLTERLVSALSTWPVTPPAPGLVWNFRLDHNIRRLVRQKLPATLLARHPLVTAADPVLPPDDDLLQLQTKGRHYPAYFQTLHTHRLTAAFGGNFRPVGSRSPALAQRVLRRLQSIMLNVRFRLAGVRDYDTYLAFVESHPRLLQVHQPDSWRWWESLLSASVPLHLDLADHGWLLPVMPENGVHYLGLRGWDFDDFARRILALDEDALHAIALAGRAWALENYSPRACALRLLSWLDNR